LFLENAGNLEQRLIWNTPNGGAGWRFAPFIFSDI
jgi:hypothetical protein